MDQRLYFVVQNIFYIHTHYIDFHIFFIQINGTYTFRNVLFNETVHAVSVSGVEGNLKRKRVPYADANVFVICFSVVDETTWDNVEKLVIQMLLILFVNVI